MKHKYIAAILEWYRIGFRIKRVPAGGIGEIISDKDFHKGEIITLDKGDFKIVRIIQVLMKKEEGCYLHDSTILHVKPIKRK